MDETISFSILEIEKTKEKQAIQDAYRRLLVKVNPEDDPEGFKRLREAYEAANAYADRPEELKKAPETPVELWIERVREIYFSLSKRLDVSLWEGLLKDDICLDLDTSVEIRDALLDFLADNYRIKTDIWKMIDKTFNLQEERAELLEKFHPNFIDFVMHQCQSDDDFPYEAFQGADDGDYDTFLYHYYELCRKNDSGDVEGAGGILDTLKHLPVSHPYLMLEEARLERNRQELSKASGWIHGLLALMEDDMRSLAYGGEIFWENGEKEEAKDCFEKILKDCPTHYMANKYLAKHYQEQGDPVKAKEYCVEALRVSSQEEALLETMRDINQSLMKLYEERLEKEEISDDDVMELGWCYLQNDLFGKGVALLEGRTMGDSKKAEYYSLLSKCYLMEQQYQKAVDAARACIPCIQTEAEAREAEAEEEEKGKQLDRIPGRIAGACEIIAKALHTLAKEGELSKEEQASCYEQALEAIDEALKQEPDSRNYRIEQAQIFMDQEEYQKAVDVCDQMIETDRNDFYAYVLRQKCCYEMHNGQGVVDNFYSAKDIYNGYPQIYELAADVFIRYGQYDDARGILKQAEEAEVGSPKLDLIHLTIGRETAEKDEEFKAAYEEAKKLEEKFKEYRESVTDEQMAELYYEIARCCRGLDRQRDALKYIEKACSLHQDKLYLWIRANTLADLKEHDRAMADYQLCEKEYGENELVYENMARCYASMGKRSQALEYYKKVLKVNEENPRANSRIVDIYTDILKDTGDLKYFKEAVPFATRQLELDPCAYYYIERGLLYLEAGEWDLAEADFIKAAELEPDNTYAYNNQGCIYKYTEQYEKAVELFKKSIEVMEESETIIAYSNLGGTYERMCDFTRALEWYQKGSREFPQNRAIRKDIIRVLKKMQLLDKAMEEIKSFYGEDTIAYYLETGEIYVQMKRFAKAISLYQTARKKAENDADASDAWYHIGDVYLYYKKNPKKALECYLKALDLKNKNAYGYDRCCRSIMECYYELGTPDKGAPYQKLALESIGRRFGHIDKYLNDFYYRRSRLYNIGAMYYYLGDLEMARKYFGQIEKAAKCRHCNFQECEDYWEAMGFLYEEDGKLAEALNCYEKACRESVRNDLSIAKVELLTKKFKKQR